MKIVFVIEGMQTFYDTQTHSFFIACVKVPNNSANLVNIMLIADNGEDVVVDGEDGIGVVVVVVVDVLA